MADVRYRRTKSRGPEGEEISPNKETRVAWREANFMMGKKASYSVVMLCEPLLVFFDEVLDECRVRQD
jgi:hypothetical protein